MKKLMLIVNPHAGKQKIRNTLCSLIEKLSRGGYMCTVFITDAQHGAKKIVDDYSDDFDTILCCGGDGTLNQVISRVIKKEKRPPIAYIPAGTANDVATSLELSSDVLRAADDILCAEPTPYDVGVFGATNFIYIASFGAFTDASYSTPQDLKNALGQFAYILQGAKSVQSIKSNHIKVETDDTTFEGDYVFGAMINSFSFAGMFKLNPEEVSFNDGQFEVMLIKTPRNLQQLQNAATCLLKRQYDEKYVTFFHTSHMKITCDEPIPWTTDGEFGDVYQTVELGVLKRAVTLLLKEGTFLGSAQLDKE